MNSKIRKKPLKINKRKKLGIKRRDKKSIPNLLNNVWKDFLQTRRASSLHLTLLPRGEQEVERPSLSTLQHEAFG
jgi:hypothetical protein